MIIKLKVKSNKSGKIKSYAAREKEKEIAERCRRITLIYTSRVLNTAVWIIVSIVKLNRFNGN